MDSKTLYQDLAWLPPPSEDFKSQVQALGVESGARDFRVLANSALSAPQTTLLARRRRAIAKDLVKPPIGLDWFRLGVLSNCTANHLTDALEAAALRHGLWLDVVESGYDAVSHAGFTDTKALFGEAPVDAVLLAVNWHGLPVKTDLGDHAGAMAAEASAAGYIGKLSRTLMAGTQVPVILQTVVPPPEHGLANYDRQLAGTPRRLALGINERLAIEANDSGAILFDVAAIAELVGTANWFNPVHWHWVKLPFDPVFVGLYASRLAGLLGAMRGKARRVAVFDLDNTLWGGVIGDDGIDGIRIGQGSAAGEAFLAVQRLALALKERGIVLAISSKNEEATALEAIRRHPEMLLREADFAAHRINWIDKPTNIKSIAKMLDLGLESVVFLDDNPAERARVRQMLPEVAVPEIGTDPAHFPRIIAASGFFEMTSFSSEDRQRADMYRANAQRVVTFEILGDYDAYLTSLDMTMTTRPFDEIGQKRIVQLINKTNQFNLTTRRYSEPEVQGFRLSPRHHTLQVRLEDRFGDNGMIAVTICHKLAEDWRIDCWLMSCRVLKRRVEEAMLAELATAARSEGARRLVGEYIPTVRNILVADHYKKLGFELVEQRDDGSEVWALQLEGYETPELPFRYVRGLAEAGPSMQAGE